MSIKNSFGHLTAAKALPSTLDDGTAIVGAIIDRLGYQSALLVFSYEASTGTPSAAVTSLIVEDGDNSTLSDAATFATLETAKNIKTAGIAQYNIDLSKAKRYIRFTNDTTYTAGSSPKNQLAADVVLFDKDVDADTSTVYGR